MRRSIKWVVAALVLLLVVGGAMRLLAARKERAAAEPVAKAQAVAELAATDVLKARTVELSQGLPVSGSLRAVNSALVKARVAGELQGLSVREGDAVRANQVIARIDATEYQARLRQANEQAAAAKAQIDIAQRQWDNNKALVDQGFISKTALDTSLNNLNAARSTWQAAVAASDLAKKAVDDTVLRAPIAGVVSQRLAQPGERIGVDARVVEIVDLSRLELEASLSAADSVQVRVGQAGRAAASKDWQGRWRRAWCGSIRAPRPAAAACWPTWRWRMRPGCGRGCSRRAGWRPARRAGWRCRWRPCARTSRRRTCRWWTTAPSRTARSRRARAARSMARAGSPWTVLPRVRW